MTAPVRRRRVILMRHGAVQYFDPASQQPLPAHSVPLTPEGLAQARTAGLALAAAGVRTDLAIASGLPRTVQTAQVVLAAQSQLQAPLPALHTWPEWEEARGRGFIAKGTDATGPYYKLWDGALIRLTGQLLSAYIANNSFHKLF